MHEVLRRAVALNTAQEIEEQREKALAQKVAAAEEQAARRLERVSAEKEAALAEKIAATNAQLTRAARSKEAIDSRADNSPSETREAQMERKRREKVQAIIREQEVRKSQENMKKVDQAYASVYGDGGAELYAAVERAGRERGDTPMPMDVSIQSKVQG